MNQQEKRVFIFIGPPGSGKGSLAQLCSKEFGWEMLSTGNLCRKHVEQGTQIGKKIDFAIKSGNLISDDLIIQMVIEWFSEQVNKAPALILDGYPRTVYQAEAFQLFLEKEGLLGSLQIVNFDISDDEIISRLCHRQMCENKDCQVVYSCAPGSSLAPQQKGVCDYCGADLIRRKDDDESVVRSRLETYHQHKNDLLHFYQQAGQQVICIDVNRPLEKVFESFKKLLHI